MSVDIPESSFEMYIPETGVKKLVEICIVYLANLEQYGGDKEMMLTDAAAYLGKHNSDDEVSKKVSELISSLRGVNE